MDARKLMIVLDFVCVLSFLKDITVGLLPTLDLNCFLIRRYNKVVMDQLNELLPALGEERILPRS